MIINNGFLDFRQEDFFKPSVEMRIAQAQEDERKSAFNKMACKHISIGDGSSRCTVAGLRKALILSGVSEDDIAHRSNDFSEMLTATVKGVEFTIQMPMFPKSKMEMDIDIRITEPSMMTRVSRKALPYSVVNFLAAVAEWIPNYLAIAENIRVEEEKKQIAGKIAFELVEKIAGDKLREKGYLADITHSSYSNTASIRISYGGSIDMRMNIKLLGDFLDDLNLLIDLLPKVQDSGLDCKKI